MIKPHPHCNPTLVLFERYENTVGREKRRDCPRVRTRIVAAEKRPADRPVREATGGSTRPRSDRLSSFA
ncbi:hypothetical protein EA473_10305 [Natrarchaeobius chitinivorans]|uniref:Uncharacterized protein n=1 Tax=Natrarchaeobius chitinivorans TaxID=1679083 RepID=A0A3N6MH14_NATCH|nr:hypothetical protein EA473_10305 [Natrarchaeobius chitinivorans]